MLLRITAAIICLSVVVFIAAINGLLLKRLKLLDTQGLSLRFMAATIQLLVVIVILFSIIIGALAALIAANAFV